jgi:uncharacterized membrane protein
MIIVVVKNKNMIKSSINFVLLVFFIFLLVVIISLGASLSVCVNNTSKYKPKKKVH